MKNFTLPSAQSILMIIAALVAILTWLVPSGKYDSLSYNSDKNEFVILSQTASKSIAASQESLDELGIKIPVEKFTSGAIYKPISIPKTYTQVEPNPQGFVEFVQAPIKGIIAAADIIFLVLIIGGLIGIMNLSGAFDSGISWLANAIKGKEYVLIILTTTLVAIGGSTFGLAEESLAFYPIVIPIFVAARYDAMVGFASVFLGSSIGNMCSTTNPFSIIIASDAAGINWTTGLESRMLMFVICIGITVAYLIWYALRVKNDPTKSIIYSQKAEMEQRFGLADAANIKPLNLQLKLILLIFAASFGIMIYGVSQLGWWFTEMMSTFLVGAILIGFVARLKETQFLTTFMSGASDLLGVAFIIGIARGISILMDEGRISDTVLFHVSSLTEGMNKGVFINSLFFIYNGLTFFIPSQSGTAVLTMPIMSPLADTIGIGRDVIINAYQFGNGLFNAINPTGLVLASLAIVKIDYAKFLKFAAPLLAILYLAAMLFLTISVYS